MRIDSSKSVYCQLPLPPYTEKELADYLASGLGEVVSVVSGRFVVGKTQGKGSISISKLADGRPFATDFATDAKAHDLFYWIGEIEGIDSFPAQIKRAYQILGRPIPDPRKAERGRPTFVSVVETTRDGLFTDEFKAILKQRGIDGLDLTGLNQIGFVETGKQITCGNSIIYGRSLVVWDDARHIKAMQLDEEGKRKQQCGIIQIGGNTHPRFIELDNTKPVYLVEGEFDALALISLGLQALPLKPDKTTAHLIKQLKYPVIAYDADGSDSSGGLGFEKAALRIDPCLPSVRLLWADLDDPDPNGFVACHDAETATEMIRSATTEAYANVDRDKEKTTALKTLYEELADYQTRDGHYKPSHASIVDALSCKWFTGYEIAYDVFSNDVVVKSVYSPTARWEVVTDKRVTELTTILEKQRGFTVIPKQLFRDCLDLVADTKKINSFAIMLSNILPDWDGVDRISNFFTDHFGFKPETELEGRYSKALALNMFTSMYARATHNNPFGIQCDYSTVLVSKGGLGKGKTLRILSLQDYIQMPTFVSINLAETKRDDIARKMQGRVIAEMGERGGLGYKDANLVKDFMTSLCDTLVPKFRERAVDLPRHCIFVVTTNDDQFLNDPTGNRRFAPITLPEIDDDTLERNEQRLRENVLQVWAQAKVLFEQNGMMWKDLKKLVNVFNKQYEIRDAWFERIEAYIMRNHITTIRSASDIATGVLMMDIARVDNGVKIRIGNVLKQLGFTYKTTRITAEKKRNGLNVNLGDRVNCYTRETPLESCNELETHTTFEDCTDTAYPQIDVQSMLSESINRAQTAPATQKFMAEFPEFDDLDLNSGFEDPDPDFRAWARENNKHHRE